MRLVAAWVVACTLFALPIRAAECPESSKCLPKEDVQVFARLLQEKKCLQGQKPEFTVDPINIVIDQDGRVFGSGSNPVPWTIRMKWCSYEVEAAGQVKINVAVREPPTWGFRFRPKAAVGILGVEAFARDRFVDAVDVGVLVEPFFYRAFNINAAAGMRSFGVGIGLDLTRTVSLYAGYAMTYVERRSNPYLGVAFALW